MDKFYFDPDRIKIEHRSHSEPGLIEITDSKLWVERADWLQVENIQDQDGNMVPTVTLNQPLKDQILEQEFNDELAEQAEKNAKEAKKAALKAIKKQDLATVDELKQVILDIIEEL